MQDPQKAAKDAGDSVSEGVEGAINKGKDSLKDLTGRAEDAVDDLKGYLIFCSPATFAWNCIQPLFLPKS